MARRAASARVAVAKDSGISATPDSGAVVGVELSLGAGLIEACRDCLLK
jgi:hypothetical protein